MVVAHGGATSHTYVSSFPVDFWVVKLEPSVAKGELVFPKVENMKGDRLLMVLGVHVESDGVSDVTDLVQSLVSIVGGNGLCKECGWE